MKNKISFKIFAILLVTALALGLMLSLAACNKDGERFGKDVRFGVNNEKLDFMGTTNEGGTIGFIEELALDMDQTYFEFKKDGTVHGQIQTREDLFEILDDVLGLLSQYFGVDISDFSSIDLSQWFSSYVDPMFPGFSDKLKDGDLAGALELVHQSLGFNIVGMDMSKPEFKAVVKEVGETGMLNVQSLLDCIPSDTVLKLTMDWNYYIRTVKGADGKEQKAIYVGDDVAANYKQTQPFAIFTMTEGKKRELILRIEFMKITLALIEA